MGLKMGGMLVSLQVILFSNKKKPIFCSLPWLFSLDLGYRCISLTSQLIDNEE